MRVHDLRHSATGPSLAAANDLKTVQAVLGQNSIVCTADAYASVLPGPARRPARAAEARTPWRRRAAPLAWLPGYGIVCVR